MFIQGATFIPDSRVPTFTLTQNNDVKKCLNKGYYLVAEKSVTP